MDVALPLGALRAGISSLARQPTMMFRFARGAAKLQIVVPLDALRWFFAQQAERAKKFPKDLQLAANPPALSIKATVTLMGQVLHTAADVKIDELRLSSDELRVTLKVAELRIDADNPNSPAAMLFRSMDLTKPGNLLGFLPFKPATIVEASGDTFVLDLMKIPSIAENPTVRRIVSVLTTVVVVRDIRTEDDSLVISWRPNVAGIAGVLSALRGR